jgi:hypothetical protein
VILMGLSISPETIRQLVIDQFSRLCDSFRADLDLHERVKIERGRPVARCYHGGTLMAMWMVDIGLVQFYDQQGNMLQTWSLLPTATAERKAA